VLYQLAMHTVMPIGSQYLLHTEFLGCLALGIMLPLIHEPQLAWLSRAVGEVAK
jgi:hypothetical protein